MRRQQLLAAGTVGLHLVIDEAVLLRSVGSEPVMAGQLEHLLSRAALPFVTLQVAGLSEAHLRLSQSFTVLRFADEVDAAACFDAGAGRVSLINHAAEVDAAQDTFAVLARTAMSPDNSAVGGVGVAVHDRLGCAGQRGPGAAAGGDRVGGHLGQVDDAAAAGGEEVAQAVAGQVVQERDLPVQAGRIAARSARRQPPAVEADLGHGIAAHASEWADQVDPAPAREQLII
jgi:Domain of unknown function (DUF5753)